MQKKNVLLVVAMFKNVYSSVKCKPKVLNFFLVSKEKDTPIYFSFSISLEK